MAEYPRRSTRAITSVPAYSNFQSPQQQNFRGGNQFNAAGTSPVLQQQQPTQLLQAPPVPPNLYENATEPKLDGDLSGLDVSATTKALQDGDPKKPWKFARLPKAIRKKRLNSRLAKIMAPKTALMLLHEMKPGVTMTVTQEGLMTPFVAEAILDGQVVGKGHGPSKADAKTAAAEAVIKKFVTEIMAESKAASKEKLAATPVEGKEGEAGEAMEQDSVEGADEEESCMDKLPWAGLASFAMYKLFDHWTNDGTEVAIGALLKKKGPPAQQAAGSPPKTMTKALPRNPPTLPDNPTAVHPAALLNQMRPGCQITEISRTPAPNSSVTVAYELDGQLFHGTAPNRKAARKEAAKTALTALYGVVYTS